MSTLSGSLGASSTRREDDHAAALDAGGDPARGRASTRERTTRTKISARSGACVAWAARARRPRRSRRSPRPCPTRWTSTGTEAARACSPSLAASVITTMREPGGASRTRSAPRRRRPARARPRRRARGAARWRGGSRRRRWSARAARPARWRPRSSVRVPPAGQRVGEARCTCAARRVHARVGRRDRTRAPSRRRRRRPPTTRAPLGTSPMPEGRASAKRREEDRERLEEQRDDTG
jgi:hypothetical protein